MRQKKRVQSIGHSKICIENMSRNMDDIHNFYQN